MEAEDCLLQVRGQPELQGMCQASQGYTWRPNLQIQQSIPKNPEEERKAIRERYGYVPPEAFIPVPAQSPELVLSSTPTVFFLLHLCTITNIVKDYLLITYYKPLYYSGHKHRENYNLHHASALAP